MNWTPVGVALATGGATVAAAWVASFWHGKASKRRAEQEAKQTAVKQRQDAYLNLLVIGERWNDWLFTLIWARWTYSSDAGLQYDLIRELHSFRRELRDAVTRVRLLGVEEARRSATELASAASHFETTVARELVAPEEDVLFFVAFSRAVARALLPWLDALRQFEAAVRRDREASGL